MLMTLKVAESRKIPSFFICMQMDSLHKLTPEPRRRTSSGAPDGPLLGAGPRRTRACPSQSWSAAHLWLWPWLDDEKKVAGEAMLTEPPQVT